MTITIPPAPAVPGPPLATPVTALAARPARRLGSVWVWGLVILSLLAAGLTVWGVGSGSRSEYYASIALSMSQDWSNFFFGAFDPAGTVTLDKIPGSFWIPALFVKLFGFSTWTIILPNALAAVGAALLTAFAGKRLAGPTAGLLAGAAVATTPILVAVSRSNQPETFFVLGLALTAWAAVKALTRPSFGWLLIAGLFIALSFQTYMLEAWAVWPALAAAYLCTKQPWIRKIWHTIVAGAVSLAASLVWIVIVSLVPASARPYIGSTLHNDPWEMVFGYNGLGRFGDSTADASAYRSFTPPFSGDASAFRLFNEQLAGQIAWLLPVAILGIVVLAVLRWRPAVTVFLGVWLVTFAGMFSVVAGMHQFYTAALAIPMALSLGVAFAVARRRRVRWAQMALVSTAAVTALVISFAYASAGAAYSTVFAVMQFLAAGVAIAMIGWERERVVRAVTPFVAGIAMLLTPLAWSVVTIWNPSSINPVAGGVSDMSGMGGFGGAGGFGGQGAPRIGGGQNGQGGQAGPGGQNGQGAPGGQGGPGGQNGVPAQGAPGGAGQGGGFGGGQGDAASSTLLSYLEQNRGSAKYLVAVFGAQSAASLITASGGQAVLPIGGFNGTDPAPTFAAFQTLVAGGELKYVMVSDQGGFGGGVGQSESGDAAQIRSWVQQNCTQVTDAGVSGLYVCTP
ncbi:ArnT family glycosyltransferase [Microbacterium sp. ASV49]|uniref:Glycosyltransferase family 39 protein n=1 Tax=Microbacterium candidum TaxID=3041922 RepID=A0ABT7N007_9MICO|nr:glycosyltransferase family 39 protein [Microbacterium sp. ASV49]MDL9980035.1 glycosyltransferase family 39 protein [Microbacterium sp. ASV49]